MRLTASLILSLLLSTTASAQDAPCTGNNRGDFSRIAPNMQHVVAQVVADYPEEFRAANDLTREDTRFIRRLAWTLHAIDPRWGLNGKRGNPNDLSQDVVAYVNESVDHGSEAFDVIANHGAPNASAGWFEITCEIGAGGSGGFWIRPEPVDGDKPTPPPPPQTNPDLESLRQRVTALEVLIIEVGSADEQRAANLRMELEVVKGQVRALAEGFEAHRKEVEAYKNFFQKWIVERLIPVVGGVLGILGAAAAN